MIPESFSGMGLYDAIVQACLQAGFDPKIGQRAPQLVSILSLISANLGVSLIPESAMQVQLAGIQHRRLQAPFRMSVWRWHIGWKTRRNWRLILPVS
jgi:DNA-binding transcriptional LysR family regulator